MYYLQIQAGLIRDPKKASDNNQNKLRHSMACEVPSTFSHVLEVNQTNCLVMYFVWLLHHHYEKPVKLVMREPFIPRGLGFKCLLGHFAYFERVSRPLKTVPVCSPPNWFHSTSFMLVPIKLSQVYQSTNNSLAEKKRPQMIFNLDRKEGFAC